MAYQKKKEDLAISAEEVAEERSVAAESENKKDEEIAIQPPEVPAIEPPREKSGKVFLGDEDRRLLKKLNKHIVNKLGLSSSRSIKL